MLPIIRKGAIALGLLWLLFTLFEPPSMNLGRDTFAAKVEKKILRINLGQEPADLNLHQASDFYTQTVLRHLYEGLTRLQSDGRAELALAKSCQVSSNGRAYLFQLRKSLWSNGKPLLAQDFIASWKAALDPEQGSLFSHLMDNIVGAKDYRLGKGSWEEVGLRAVDDEHLEVRLIAPQPRLLELFSTPFLFPQSQEEGKRLICNGPFILESWHPQDHMRLKANRHFWEASRVKLKEFEFLFIEDPRTQQAMFENKELDWVGAPYVTLSHEDQEVFNRMGLLELHPQSALQMISFNTQKPLLSHPKVRRALSLVIDRKLLTSHLIPNSEPAYAFLPPQLRVTPHSPSYFEEDVGEAQALLREGLEELGMDKEAFKTLTFSYTPAPLYQNLAQAIVEQWKTQLGIEVGLQVVQWKVLLGQMFRGSYDMARLLWWGDYPDPLSFMQLFREEDGGRNMPRWHDDRVKELLAEAELEQEEGRRQTLIELAERRVIEEMPIIPLYYSIEASIKQPRLQGVAITPQGIDLRDAYIIR